MKIFCNKIAIVTYENRNVTLNPSAPIEEHYFFKEHYLEAIFFIRKIKALYFHVSFNTKESCLYLFNKKIFKFANDKYYKRWV